MKECSRCKIVKPLDGFSKNAKGKQGRHSLCKVCVQQYWAARHAANPEIYKNYRLKTKYGLTPAQVKKMLQEQDHTCPICLKYLDEPNIDHCHKSNVVRGILCQACNLALGLLEDDTDRLARAAAYLTTHEQE